MHLVMRRLIPQVDRTLEVQPTAHKCAFALCRFHKGRGGADALVMRRLISQVDRTLEVQPTAHKCVAPALGAMHLVMRRLISQVDRTLEVQPTAHKCVAPALGAMHLVTLEHALAVADDMNTFLPKFESKLSQNH